MVLAVITESNSSIWLLLLPVLHTLAVSVGIIHILMQKPKVGIAFAWIILIVAFPVAGVALYFLVGERRISLHRRKKLTQDRQRVQLAQPQLYQQYLPILLPPHAQRLISLLQASTHETPGIASHLQLYADTHAVLHQIAAEIEQAQTSIWMEFYIWYPGGDADVVLTALENAARRGVQCYLLLDDIGSAHWWRSQQPKRLRSAGVQVHRALPSGLFRAMVGRTDLRLHRKIVVVDNRIAWTGSMNLVDPRYFKQNAGVGQWVDAMLRIEGPFVLTLLNVVVKDWWLENPKPEPIKQLAIPNSTKTESEPRQVLQTIASGPGQTTDELLLLLQELIHSAQQEIVITTPYFVPDDALVLALRAAALRGVKVIVLAPEKNDSLLVHYAAESYYAELMQTGVEIHLFHGGLLHTKSVTVDQQLALFGTVNLDMRSLWINYEVSLLVYDADFTQQLRHLQESYLQQSKPIDSMQWQQRSYPQQLLQNGMRLLAPLL